MTFSEWWVSVQGSPPLPEQGGAFRLARLAWDTKAEIRSELNEKLRIQIEGLLVERDEAVREGQRHLELRQQAEKQCGRAQKERDVSATAIRGLKAALDALEPREDVG